MTELLLITIGLAILLIAVESVGLRRLARRCDSETWKEAIRSLKKAKEKLKEAKRAGEGDTVIESRVELAQARKNTQEARKKFGKELNCQVNALWVRRREPLKNAACAIRCFSKSVRKATLASLERIVSPKAAGIATPPALLLVLALSEVRYYNLFDFNVLPYLADYPASALLLGVLQVLLLLGLSPLLFVASIVIVLPRAGLRLIRIVDGMRALVAKGIGWVFIAACGRWTPCSFLALQLLDQQSGDVDDSRSRRLVEPTIRFVGKYGSRLILKADRPDSEPYLTSVAWFVVGALFFAVSYIAIELEPRYKFHAICGEPKGSRNVRVFLDPPLAGGKAANFTRIGSMGGNIFIVRESCGHQPRTTDEDQKTNVATSATSVASESEEPPGSTEPEPPETNGQANGESDLDEMAVLRFVVDGIQRRLRFRFSLDYDRLGDYSPTVTVVPLNRILCMHEDHGDGSDESVDCKPLLRPVSAGLRIIVHETIENTIWTIVGPPGVRVRMDEEWLLKNEIARRRCDGGPTKISEPILFKRAQIDLADERVAEATIKAFLAKPELQNVKLHVIGFASGDGNSQYNDNLARQRARAVVAIVQNLAPRRTPIEDSWGETHLTNGVANSRSVRLVGCRPEAEDSSDSTNQQAHAITSEPQGQDETAVQ